MNFNGEENGLLTFVCICNDVNDVESIATLINTAGKI
jgi:hypothetical protein